MTLKVQIYNASFNVTYPSEQRVGDLIEEYATMCRGDRKPESNRRFFVCIYCGADWFSNKMMLNQHRFIRGCPNAKYPDGKPALLLPYPDLKTGEGKKVEVLSKKNAAVKTELRGTTEHPTGGDEDIDGNIDDGLLVDGHGAMVEVEVPPFTKVPQDLLWKEVPPRKVPKAQKPPTGKAKNRKAVPKKVPVEDAPKRETGSMSITAAQPQPKRDIGLQIRAVKELKGVRSTDEAFDKCGTGAGLRRSKRKAEEPIVCDTGEDDDDFVTLNVLHKTGKSTHSDLKLQVPGKMEIDGSFHVSVRGHPGERPCKLTRADEGSTEEVSPAYHICRVRKKKRFQRFEINLGCRVM